MIEDIFSIDPPDRSHISTTEDWEVEYWRNFFDVSEYQLIAAVRQVENSIDAVRRALGK